HCSRVGLSSRTSTMTSNTDPRTQDTSLASSAGRFWKWRPRSVCRWRLYATLLCSAVSVNPALRRAAASYVRWKTPRSSWTTSHLSRHASPSPRGSSDGIGDETGRGDGNHEASAPPCVGALLGHDLFRDVPRKDHTEGWTALVQCF